MPAKNCYKYLPACTCQLKIVIQIASFLNIASFFLLAFFSAVQISKMLLKPLMCLSESPPVSRVCSILSFGLRLCLLCNARLVSKKRPWKQARRQPSRLRVLVSKNCLPPPSQLNTTPRVFRPVSICLLVCLPHVLQFQHFRSVSLSMVPVIIMTSQCGSHINLSPFFVK